MPPESANDHELQRLKIPLFRLHTRHVVDNNNNDNNHSRHAVNAREAPVVATLCPIGSHGPLFEFKTKIKLLNYVVIDLACTGINAHVGIQHRCLLLHWTKTRERHVIEFVHQFRHEAL